MFVPPAIVNVSEFVPVANEPESDVTVLIIFGLLPKSEFVNVTTLPLSAIDTPVPPANLTKL